MDAPESFEDGTLDVDGNMVGCRRVEGTRKFKSIVKISDENGNFVQTSSNAEEFHRDCVDNDEPEIISAAQDEVIADGCGGDVCVDHHEKTTARFYGCDIAALNPAEKNRLFVARGDFGCDQPMHKRLVYVKICDNIARSGDPCADMSSRKLSKGNSGWTGEPKCIPTPITYSGPVVTYEGTYSRAGIDPRKQEGGIILPTATSKAPMPISIRTAARHLGDKLCEAPLEHFTQAVGRGFP